MTVCASHGGKAPQVVAAASRRLAQAAAEADLVAWHGELDGSAEVHALSVLRSKAWRVARLKRRIGEFEAGRGDVVSVEHMAGMGYDSSGVLAGALGGAEPALLVLERPGKDSIRLTENPLLAMLRVEERDLLHAAKICHDMGIEQKRLDMHREMAEFLLLVHRRALPELGLDPDDDRVIDVMSRALAAAG